MEAEKLDPEVKWRSLAGLLFNYIIAVNNVLLEKVGKAEVNEIQQKIAKDFWMEQAQAFIQIFGLKPGNVLDAHTLVRTYATLFDIRYQNISESPKEIVDQMEYANCLFRKMLGSLWPEICHGCEFIGQVLIKELDPTIEHHVAVKNGQCYHTTSLKTSSKS
ncbi:MAG: hypothetical protein EU536_03900 [Promethearchaeota archaeon]|nr:MAG: hypothetical protein EU536_03900 [Candidatus Lokiarchaeota archaeon]